MDIDLMGEIGKKAAQIHTNVFDKHDWEAWASAVPFSEYHDPWITTMHNPIPEYQDWPTMVIIGDNEGIYVHFCGADFEGDTWFTFTQKENPNYSESTSYWLCRAVVKMALHGKLSEKFARHPKPSANKIFKFYYEGSMVIEAETVEEAKQIFESVSDGICTHVSGSGDVSEFSEPQWVDIAEPARPETEPTHISQILPKVMEEVAIRSDLQAWWDNQK